MKSLLKALIFTIFQIIFFLNTVKAQTDIEKEYQMKQYFMVFLTTGQNRTQDSITAAKIQEGHLGNITRLFSEKKIVLAGPFLDNGKYRGIFIFDVPTEEEVRQLLQTDPAIIAGRLGYEIHPWYGPAHIILKPKLE